MPRFRAPTTVYGTVDEVNRRSVDDQSAPDQGAPEGDDTRRDRRVVRRNKFSDALAADAKSLFEERLGRPVTDGEARQWLGNLTDMLWLLIDWEAARLKDVEPMASPSGRSDTAKGFDPGDP